MSHIFARQKREIQFLIGGRIGLEGKGAGMNQTELSGSSLGRSKGLNEFQKPFAHLSQACIPGSPRQDDREISVTNPRR